MFRLRKGIVIITIILIHVAFAQKECNTTDLIRAGCSETETCIAKSNTSQTGYCDCLSWYVRVNESLCVPPAASEDPSRASSSSLVENTNGHLAAAITIPLFVIALVICGIYISYRYKFYAWMCSKIYQTNPNYDEVMIGQDLDDDDDPPLR